MSDMLHLTYASENNYHLHRLHSSAAHHGISLRVLGLGEPWTALLQKLEAVRRVLEGTPGDWIVHFVDAYDTIYLQPPSVIAAKFRDFGRPVVFSAEMCFHAPGNEAVADRYPPSPTPYRYLNSGCYMGYAAPLAAILDRVLDNPATDHDQSLLSRYFVDHPESIALDYQTDLFMATAGRPYDEDLVLDGDSMVNRQTGTRPCVLHTPGKYYGVLEYYAWKLPFYRDIPWSRLSAGISWQIAKGVFNLHAYRALKRLRVIS